MNWVIELALVCEPHYKMSLIGTCFFAGFLVGSLTLVRLADRLGRKPILYASLFLQLGLPCVSFFVHTLWMLYVMIFFTGLFSVTRASLMYVLLNELAGQKWRTTIHF